MEEAELDDSQVLARYLAAHGGAWPLATSLAIPSHSHVALSSLSSPAPVSAAPIGRFRGKPASVKSSLVPPTLRDTSDKEFQQLQQPIPQESLELLKMQNSQEAGYDLEERPMLNIRGEKKSGRQGALSLAFKGRTSSPLSSSAAAMATATTISAADTDNSSFGSATYQSSTGLECGKKLESAVTPSLQESSREEGEMFVSENELRGLNNDDGDTRGAKCAKFLSGSSAVDSWPGNQSAGNGTPSSAIGSNIRHFLSDAKSTANSIVSSGSDFHYQDMFSGLRHQSGEQLQEGNAISCQSLPRRDLFGSFARSHGHGGLSLIRESAPRHHHNGPRVVKFQADTTPPTGWDKVFPRSSVEGQEGVRGGERRMEYQSGLSMLLGRPRDMKEQELAVTDSATSSSPVVVN